MSGNYSLLYNTKGTDNTASGYYSLYSNTTGNYNSAIGKSSLYSNTTGEFNVAVGNRAGFSLTTGSNNSVFGSYAYVGSSSGSNRTVIGYDTSGQADNSVTLGNSDVTAVYMGEDSGAKVYAGEGSFTGDMTIGGDVVVSSDARLKSNIVSLGSTLSRLLLIDGKSYEMKGKQKIGVLAQEIKEVFPELVTEDDNEMLAVNYQGLVPVLINALKEQDGKMKEQESKFEKQQAEIEELKEMVNQLISSK